MSSGIEKWTSIGVEKWTMTTISGCVKCDDNTRNQPQVSSRREGVARPKRRHLRLVPGWIGALAVEARHEYARQPRSLSWQTAKRELSVVDLPR